MSNTPPAADGARTARTSDADATSSLDTEVPPGADPHVCRHCGRPFVREEYLSLHRGQAHPDALSETERTAYESASETERAGLRRFQLLALAALVFVYFGFLFAYAVFA